MSNKCPKCGEKLSPLYMKQNCPKCNTNLVYYDLDNRLRADHEKAIKEQEAVDRVLNNIKTSAFGGPVQIVRFILMFSPLLWMCLPMFTVRDHSGGGDNSMSGNSLSLLSLILDLINNKIEFGDILSTGVYTTTAITCICIVVFSLAVIISSLFSVGEKSLKRNLCFSIINLIILLGNICWCLFECNPSIGIVIIIIVYILQIVLHKSIDKKLNK